MAGVLSAPRAADCGGPPPVGAKELGSGPSFLERRWVAVLAAAALGPAAASAPVADPTRPPAAVQHVAAGAEPAPLATPRLQMIVRGPGESRSALIDGRPLRTGELLTSSNPPMRVLRITDHSVELGAGGVRATLELVPGAEAAVRGAARPPAANPR